MNLLRSVSVVALTVILGLTACSKQDEGELLAAARRDFKSGKVSSGIINVKAVLQENPASGEARYLLGRALLDGGDTAAALLELEKAIDRRFDDNQVFPTHAQALLLQGQAARVISLYAQTQLQDQRARAMLKTAVATAYWRTGADALAEKTLAEALKDAPDYVTARVLEAGIESRRGNFDRADAVLDDVLAREPKNAHALHLKGDIALYHRRDVAAATALFRRAVEANPKFLPAQEALITLLLQRKDVAGAKAQVAVLKKALPGLTQTMFFDAQIALLDRDYPRARELVQEVLKSSPKNVKILQLAGLIEFERGSLLQAEVQLNKAIQLAPDLKVARRLLAQTYLRLDNPARALAVLDPLLSGSRPDAQALVLAAEAHLYLGDAQRSEAYFSSAAKLHPEDPKIRTALALQMLAKGDPARAFAELETVSSADQNSILADMALVMSRMRRNENDLALKAVAAIERKQPDNPFGPTTRARVMLIKKDAAAARSAFEEALVKDPVYMPAIAGLAAMDVAEKQPQQAIDRYGKLLKADPRNYRAQLAIAELSAANGAPAAEVGTMIANAVRMDPAADQPRAALVNHHLKQRDAKAALTAAQEAVIAAGETPLLLDALGRAQASSGDQQQALVSFRKWATAESRSTVPLTRVADVYLSLGQIDQATATLRRALEVDPAQLSVRRRLITLELGQQRVAEALAVARQWQQLKPTDPVGFVLEGDIELSRRNPAKAVELYRLALTKAPTTESTMMLHSALLAARQPAEAERVAADWLRTKPEDSAFIVYLGDSARTRGNVAEAEQHYRRAVALQPDNASVLNNLAWLLTSKAPAEALAFAQRADQARPGTPVFLDTLAGALSANGQDAKAIEVQQRALKIEPNNLLLRFHLAQILSKSGDRDGAKRELEPVIKAGERFVEAEAAKRLRASL